MMSVTHDCKMPVSYFRPKYPSDQNPDNNAYVAALSKTRQIVLSPKFYGLLNELLKDDNHTEAAIKILARYLDELVKSLKESDAS